MQRRFCKVPLLPMLGWDTPQPDRMHVLTFVRAMPEFVLGNGGTGGWTLDRDVRVSILDQTPARGPGN